MSRHRCGGELLSAQITIVDNVGMLQVVHTVPGLRCNKCHEELISRNTAHRLEQWIAEVEDRHAGLVTTTQMPYLVFGSATASTDDGLGNRDIQFATSAVGA